ncbi:MAG: apolipoprotein N-acyltransferase [Geminocystis sp.]|nr:apolipoprotein N-acyltransferase [Geminocystis sp.]HIK36778.1 apolipoprotein N-acyltransferase [Geminocystis sp. M7585_C2015_104]MCS7146868.1 apolipoprotein N-acyltransferase [Geminocystis sp.]MCX8078888.1 apolipoprotein N-acyltransferase [Geminocystis sp.]MDW8115693.1 apolipoprotein N-acyltransferase [Geminocystis sp.]
MGLNGAPFSLFPLAFVAIVPLISVAVDKNFFQAILAGFLWGVGFHGLMLFWITGIHPMTWMGVPWFYSLLIATFCWVFITVWGALLVTIWAGGINLVSRYISRGFCLFAPSVTISMAGVTLWCILETIWSNTPLWWSSLALTQSPHNLYLLQLLKISGSTTVTGIIVLVNFLFYQAIAGVGVVKNTGQKLVNICLGVVILFSTHYGGYAIYKKPLADKPEYGVKVGIIQGNIPNEIKLEDPGFRRAIVNYTRGYIKLAREGVDLVLTPETALPFFYDDIREKIKFNQIIKQEKIPILLGAFYSFNGEDYANSLLSIDGEGMVISRYDKIKLVPLGEYIPLEGIFGGIIRRLSPLDTHLVAGSMQQVFYTPFGKAIAAICYDSAFSEVFRQQALKGGEFIVSAANNAHYSRSMPLQHHALDVMRGIEMDRWVARATNTGYSAIIDPHGNTLWLSRLDEYQTHSHLIYRRQTTTPYLLWGDWLLKILLAFLVVNLSPLATKIPGGFKDFDWKTGKKIR